MKDVLDVYGAILFGDRALCVADIAPCERLVVLVQHVFAYEVRSPRMCIGLAISEAHEDGESSPVSETTANGGGALVGLRHDHVAVVPRSRLHNRIGLAFSSLCAV